MHFFIIIILILGDKVMSDGEKICVLCGESCVGQARIKNEKGQYAHQKCVKAKQQQKEAVVESESLYEDDYDDALGGGMDDLLGDLDTNGADDMSGAQACPGCGQRMDTGSVVCMGCGYNTQSGKLMSTKNKKVKSGSGAGGAALSGVASMGGFAASPALPLIGAIIGGTIGAAIWAAISYYLNFELGWIAIGVGALCGLGANLGGGAQTTGGGLIAGTMAAVVAICSIAAGKYLVIEFAANELGFTSERLTADDIDDEWALDKLATQICELRIENGETIDWGSQELFLSSAFWPDDYPQVVLDEVNNKWNSLDDSEIDAYKRSIADQYGSDYTYRDIEDEWAKDSMATIYVESLIDSNETIDWPDPNLPLSYASWPDEYPEDIQTETNDSWASMSSDEQYEFRENVVVEVNLHRAEFATFTGDMKESAFIESFKHPLDAVFLLFAVITAFKIGANEG